MAENISNHTQHYHLKAQQNTAPLSLSIQKLGNVLLWLGWLWLQRPALQWIGRTFSHENHRLNLILFVLLGLFILSKNHPKALYEQFVLQIPKIRVTPALLLILSTGLTLYNRYHLKANTLSGILLGLGLYSIWGFYTHSENWKKSFPALLLLLGTFPLAAHLQMYIGFPARLWTASIVQQFLQATGVESLSTQSIIVLENGIAHVDLPCSGVKSLWTGMLFFFALTWLLSRKICFRWVIVGFLFVCFLFITNTIRVLLLVGAIFVIKQPLLAESIHVPLGIVGFVGSCLLTALLLKLVPKYQLKNQVFPIPQKKNIHLSVFIFIFLFFALGVLKPKPLLAHSTNDWTPPALGLKQQKKLALTPKEHQFFQRSSKSTKATKLQFKHKSLSGSILIVYSKHWRSHHPPEICIAASGYRVDNFYSLKRDPKFQVRILELQKRKQLGFYWYQSSSLATDQFTTRIWRSIRKKEKKWVLISVILDQYPDPHKSIALKKLQQQIYNKIQQSLSP